MSQPGTSPNTKEPQSMPSTTKPIQRVIRQPNGQLRVVSGGNAGPSPLSSGPSAPMMSVNGKTMLTPNEMRAAQLRMREIAANSGRPTGGGVPLQQRTTGAGTYPANANGNKLQNYFRSPKIHRTLVKLQHLALLVVAIMVLKMVGTNAGPLPTLILFFVMYKCRMFIFIENVLSKIKNTLTGDEAAYELALRRADSMRAPVTKKEGSISQRAAKISYGFSCMQGWRRSMEDAHTMILDGVQHQPHLHTPPPMWRIPTSPELGEIRNQGVVNGEGGFFAVFDGHCGPRVAHYCSEHLYHFVTKSPAWAKKDYKQALMDGFVTMDQHLYQTHMEERSGCTAVAILISEDGKKLYCANAGDSRAIIGQYRGENFAPPMPPIPDGQIGIGNGFEALSDDHKPYNRSEQLRIQKAGGVVFNKRVNGILALSRAVGDFSFKKNKSIPWVEQAVTCLPDVKEISIDLERDQFIVLACDGIWDVRTNEDVAAFVRLRLKKKMPLHTICEQLMQSCLSNRPFGNGCDNMSVIIVTLDESAFMRSVGGSSTAGTASPQIRPSVTPPVLSPMTTPAKVEKDTSKAQASVASEDTESVANSEIEVTLPPSEAELVDDSMAVLSPKERKARKLPSLVSLPSSQGQGGSNAEEGAAEVASPSSVRADKIGFPASEGSPVTTSDVGADDEEEEEDEEAEEAHRREIAESLEAAELFSPKTPPELREKGDEWDSLSESKTEDETPEASDSAEASVGEENPAS